MTDFEAFVIAEMALNIARRSKIGSDGLFDEDCDKAIAKIEEFQLNAVAEENRARVEMRRREQCLSICE